MNCLFPASPIPSIPIGSIDEWGRVWDGLLWRCPVGIPEAPQDGNDYGRNNMTWRRVVDYIDGEMINLAVQQSGTVGGDLTVDGTITSNYDIVTPTLNVSENGYFSGNLYVEGVLGSGSIENAGDITANNISVGDIVNCAQLYVFTVGNAAEFQVGNPQWTPGSGNLWVFGTAYLQGNVVVTGTLTVGGNSVTGTTAAPASVLRGTPLIPPTRPTKPKPLKVARKRKRR